MLNKKVMSKILAGVMAAGVTLSGGVQVFASDSADSTTTKQSFRTPKFSKVKMSVDFKGDFSTEKVKAKLDGLVKSNIINQEQANKILTFMEKEFADRKAQMESLKNASEEERKAIFEKNKEVNKVGILKDLVDQKVITQDQANAVKKAMPIAQNKMIKGHGFEKGARVNLDNLVKSGTITLDEKNKIDAYLNKKAEERKAEMEKFKSMTEAERKAFFEEKMKPSRLNLADELVKEGILSQTKAEALKKSISSKNERGTHFKKNFKPSETKTN